MKSKIAELAYQGSWSKLLPILSDHPELVNLATELKGYTPLHQAAWHGASPKVVGKLLALGADRSLMTLNKSQTPWQIAKEKQSERADLDFLLAIPTRSLGQLVRKTIADTGEMFDSYDGNQLISNRIIECLGSNAWDYVWDCKGSVEERFAAAFHAVTGQPLTSDFEINCGPSESFRFLARGDFWRRGFLRDLQNNAERAQTIPLEKDLAVVSDLFDPAPTQWGLRGDIFLWMELRHALCHVSIPARTESLGLIVTSTITALVGEVMNSRSEIFVKRFSSGGMSSGMLSGQFWLEEFIPQLQQRAKWLQASWAEN